MAQNQAKQLTEYNVLKAIEEVSDWYELGIMLKFKTSRLDIIKADHHDVHKCKIALVAEWLKNHDASWDILASALRSIRHGNLADVILKKYGQGTSSSGVSTKPKESRNSPDEGTSSTSSASIKINESMSSPDEGDQIAMDKEHPGYEDQKEKGRKCGRSESQTDVNGKAHKQERSSESQEGTKANHGRFLMAPKNKDTISRDNKGKKVLQMDKSGIHSGVNYAISSHLRKNRSTLLKSMKFDTNFIAREMNSEGLLSDSDYDDITNVKSMHSSDDKASKIIKSLEYKVDINPQHLATFVGILKQNRRLYSDAIKILEGTSPTSSASIKRNESRSSPDEGDQKNLETHTGTSMIQGMSALMIASRLGHIDVVRKLVASGANLNMQNEDGLTALMFACENGHFEVVRELVSNGAQIDMKNNYGKSALMIASQLGYIEIVEYFLQNGAQVDIPAYNGSSPLMIASQFGQTKIVRKLLEGGARVNLQTDSGKSALLFACDAEHIEVVRLLIAHGAEINLQDNNGMTAVMLATLTGCSDIVELLAHGANKNE